MLYVPKVRYVAVFELDEGELFLDDEEFESDQEAQIRAIALNNNERERLGGREPDTVWFVVKSTTRFTDAFKPPRKRKIVAKK